ncbi:hypothetical protein PGT21_004085 [Puccinia graminis f. sp. tritici]|uniref:Uncharacterized protein n=1 Tax=Puccinia graminis f. sp. tritici TaxID=56615 RepID=A0A5B0NI59_PUCGR|nr:hypothetical protein PGT21_004085 [Puccinia graminis f. sp. tritici]
MTRLKVGSNWAARRAGAVGSLGAGPAWSVFSIPNARGQPGYNRGQPAKTRAARGLPAGSLNRKRVRVGLPIS